MRIGTLILIIWLIVGAIAAGQRHYYSSSNASCAKTGTLYLAQPGFAGLPLPGYWQGPIQLLT